MPCMCGDLYCWSCGPAQGNHRCVCGEWSTDHEEHTAADRDASVCVHDDAACAEAARKEAEAEAAALEAESAMYNQWRKDNPTWR